jgi:anti-sigma factor RsiW
MSTREPQAPSADELEAMAYVDGELDPGAARRFEERMAAEPALAREVSELRALEIVARKMAPPEPMDHEWARLGRDPVQRASAGLGFALILIGTLGFALWACWQIATSSMESPWVKLFLLATVAGLSLTFLTVLRGRLRTLPYDPYTHIER